MINGILVEKSPTILFRHHNGPIAQSNDGKLIVYPGTTVHMECLWMRRFGNPKWTVNHAFRNYSEKEGWVTEEGRDSTLEYRLSILDAVESDSGTFTCSTPARHDHRVDVLVRAIRCPEIPAKRGLKANNNETRFGTKVLLSCINGNSLIGSNELVCMPSGNWSAPLPVCESKLQSFYLYQPTANCIFVSCGKALNVETFQYKHHQIARYHVLQYYRAKLVDEQHFHAKVAMGYVGHPKRLACKPANGRNHFHRVSV